MSHTGLVAFRKRISAFSKAVFTFSNPFAILAIASPLLLHSLLLRAQNLFARRELVDDEHPTLASERLSLSHDSPRRLILAVQQ
jgi:hypothetical protein